MLSDWQEAWLCRTAVVYVTWARCLSERRVREKAQLMILFYGSCGNAALNRCIICVEKLYFDKTINQPKRFWAFEKTFGAQAQITYYLKVFCKKYIKTLLRVWRLCGFHHYFWLIFYLMSFQNWIGLIYQSNVEASADPCAQIILRQSKLHVWFMKHSYAANLIVRMIICWQIWRQKTIVIWISHP